MAPLAPEVRKAVLAVPLASSRGERGGTDSTPGWLQRRARRHMPSAQSLRDMLPPAACMCALASPDSAARHVGSPWWSGQRNQQQTHCNPTPTAQEAEAATLAQRLMVRLLCHALLSVHGGWMHLETLASLLRSQPEARYCLGYCPDGGIGSGWHLLMEVVADVLGSLVAGQAGTLPKPLPCDPLPCLCSPSVPGLNGPSLKGEDAAPLPCGAVPTACLPALQRQTRRAPVRQARRGSRPGRPQAWLARRARQRDGPRSAPGAPSPTWATLPPWWLSLGTCWGARSWRCRVSTMLVSSLPVPATERE